VRLAINIALTRDQLRPLAVHQFTQTKRSLFTTCAPPLHCCSADRGNARESGFRLDRSSARYGVKPHLSRFWAASWERRLLSHACRSGGARGAYRWTRRHLPQADARARDTAPCASKSANRPALFATTSARSCARVRPLKFAYSCLELLDLVRGRQHEVGDLVPTLISKIGLALAQLSDQKLARARISYLVSNRMLAHVLTDAPVQRLARRCADQDRYWGEHQVANYQTVLILNLEKTP
jgi:hypothetical protein